MAFDSQEPAWLPTARLTPDRGPVPDPAAGATTPLFSLRSLTAGEVLDRTFTLFRARLLLFTGIASVLASLQVLLSAVQMVLTHALRNRLSSTALGFAIIGWILIAALLIFLAYGIIQAATAWAATEVYLGRTASVVAAYRATLRGWLAYIGITLWQVGSAAWLPLAAFIAFSFLVGMMKGLNVLGFIGPLLLVLALIASYVGGFIFYLRNLLGIPAKVVERHTVRQTMRRSKVLARGAKGRLFLLLVVSGLLYMAVAAVMFPLAFAMQWAHGVTAQVLLGIANLFVLFLGWSIVSPILMIGLTLIYLDSRIRQEAFDISVLMADPAVPGAVAPGMALRYPLAPVPAASTAAAVESTPATPAGSPATPSTTHIHQPTEPAGTPASSTLEPAFATPSSASSTDAAVPSVFPAAEFETRGPSDAATAGILSSPTEAGHGTAS